MKQKYGNSDGTLHPKYSFVCGSVAGFFSGIIVVYYYLIKTMNHFLIQFFIHTIKFNLINYF
jgi:hypothetical protein